MATNDSCQADLVSVVVPVYNRERLVGRTLESILAQSYRELEIVAVNDGSTDGSLAVLEGFARRHPGRVVVIDQPNSGQTRARNRAIAAARGAFIAFLDSDDTWEPEKLSLQIPLFQGDNVGLVYCGVNEVGDDGRHLATVLPEPGMRGDIYLRLLARNRMTGGSVVVSRKALSSVGSFDESFQAAENWDLWIRIARRYRVDYVDRPLVNYLKHPGNMSKDPARMAAASWAILRKHLPVPPEREPLQTAYREAYANYYYAQGVQLFGAYRYREARRMFYRCWEYLPNYQDSRERVVRSLLGKHANDLLSWAKSRLLASP